MRKTHQEETRQRELNNNIRSDLMMISYEAGKTAAKTTAI